MIKTKSLIFALLLIWALIVASAFSRAAELQPAPAPTRPVATYSIVAIDPDNGQMGVAVDQHEGVRQVAMVDAQGNVAVHTGKKCIAEAGHHQGKNYSCQANMMEKNTVWEAMAKAYNHMNRGDDLLTENNVKAALAEYTLAMSIYPGNPEMVFWPVRDK